MLWLTVCGGLLVAAIFAGTIMMVGEFRERALTNSERELENTVLLLTRHFDQQFEDSDTIAADVIARLHVSGIATPETFRKWISSTDAHEILRSKAGVLSYLGDISIYDSDGQIDQLVAAVAGAEPQHFRADLLQDLQIRSAIAAEFGPRRSRSLITSNLNTVIAHRLSGEDGVFLGVMTRRIDPRQLRESSLLRSRSERAPPFRCSTPTGP